MDDHALGNVMAATKRLGPRLLPQSRGHDVCLLHRVHVPRTDAGLSKDPEQVSTGEIFSRHGKEEVDPISVISTTITTRHISQSSALHERDTPQRLAATKGQIFDSDQSEH